MEKYTAITANAQGFVALSENGSTSRVKYSSTLEARNDKSNVKHKDTSDGIFFNTIQRSMYRRLMYGLKEYSSEMIAGMSKSSIERIVQDSKKAEDILHRLKVDRYYEAETKLLNAIFQGVHQPIGSKKTDYFVKLPRKATLHKLGITTRQVCEAFIKYKLLPRDFFELSPETVKL